MEKLPYESEHKFYGDEWLEFHDFLNSLTERESVFIELSFRLNLINAREMAYKTGGKNLLLTNIKCMVELNREPDQSKHPDILKKYNITTMPQPEKEPDNTNIYN